MSGKQKREKQIELLQQSLSSIRKIAGWTTEQLGERIGVTKQTISNLENKKTTMSFPQYIAIRSIFDYEIETNKENKVLPQVINILLDEYEEFSDDEYVRIKEAINTVAAAASGGITGNELTVSFTRVTTGAGFMRIIGLFAGRGFVGPASWLKKIFKKH